MSDFMMAPGEHWDGMSIVGNPAFQTSRVAKRRRSAEEHLFAAAVYAADRAHTQGLPITAEILHSENATLKVNVLVELLANEKFRNALSDRGIPLPHETGLSPEQLSALAIYMDMSNRRNHKQKLAAAGVSDRQWRGWLRQPRFAEQLSGLSEENLAASKPIALQRLAEAAEAGEKWAIEYVLEITGRHDRRQQTVDPTQILNLLFGIIDEVVKDPEELRQIALKARGLYAPNARPTTLILDATVVSDGRDDDDGLHSDAGAGA